MEEIVMPRLSDTMERGTIARWLVHEGDTVKEGDILAEIETDKATMELSAYDEGVLLRILVQDGESAELGAPIAVVGAPGEDASGFSAAADRMRLPSDSEASRTAAMPPRPSPRRRRPPPRAPATSRPARSRAASPPTRASTCASWPARAVARTAGSSRRCREGARRRHGRAGPAASAAAGRRSGRSSRSCAGAATARPRPAEP